MSAVAATATIAGACCIVMLSLRLRAPLTADEGYLWYGVQQLLRGRVPHRDFKSYEPGRYLWSAAVALVLGRGLFAIRLSTHLFFACGLWAALWTLRKLGFDWTAIVAAAATLSLWSHPQHKQFECGWLLIEWAALTQMLLEPSAAGFAIASATTGWA